MQSMVQQKMVLSALQVLTSLFAYMQYMQTLPDYPGVAPIQQQYGLMKGGGGVGEKGAPGNSYQTKTLISDLAFRQQLCHHYLD